MALAGEALLIRQHARNKAAHGVCHRHCGYLAAGEYKVADGYLLVDTLLYKALVYTLIMTAHEHKVVVLVTQPSCRLLVVGLALRRHIDDTALAILCS